MVAMARASVPSQDMSRPRIWIALLAVAVSILVVAGLIGWVLRPSGTAQPEPEALDQVLSGSIYLPRLNRDPRTVGVLVRNDSPQPVRIVEFELITDSFQPTGPVAKDVTIPAGVATTLTVVPGPAQCGGQLAPPVAPTTARLVVTTGNQRQTVDLALPHAADEGLETRLHLECGTQFVAAALDLRLQNWSAAEDGTLRASLLVRRLAGDDPVTLHTMAGSALYALTPAQSSPIGVLLPGQSALEIPVTAAPSRCDPHAMADVKFPYLFRVWLTIADSPQLAATIATEASSREQLVQMWLALCGF